MSNVYESGGRLSLDLLDFACEQILVLIIGISGLHINIINLIKDIMPLIGLTQHRHKGPLSKTAISLHSMEDRKSEVNRQFKPFRWISFIHSLA